MIRSMKALLRREYWEHRGAFIKTPIIIGIVILTLMVIGYITKIVITNQTGSTDMDALVFQEILKLPIDKLQRIWDIQMTTISSLYLTALYFVLFFFLLGSLFEDRKNQSILFWKSLPVSDAETVLSKLIMALFIVPIIFACVFIALTLIMMLLLSIIVLIHGFNPINLIWTPANFIQGFSMVFAGIFLQMLWALPIYGWLMFSSAISKRRPFLFAVFIPSVFAFCWYWINVLTFKFTDFDVFKVPLEHIGHAMVPYASGSIRTGGFHFGFNGRNSDITDTLALLKNNLYNIEILYGAIFALFFISLAIWVRRYRNTT